MEKAKVIHVLYSGLGGHGNVVFPLLETKFGNKHENRVVFYGVEPVLEGYKSNCDRLEIPYHVIEKKPKRYLSAFKQFKRILEQEKPHTIFIHNSELIIPASKYCKRNPDCQAIYIEHENHASKSRIIKTMSRYAGLRASGVVCLSEAYAATLKDSFRIKVPIHVIPNGVDTEKYTPNLNRNNSPVIFGMASRMIPGKDHPTLFRAFKKVVDKYPTVELQIAGEGETFGAVKKLATDLKLQDNIKFLGLLNASEMLEFYNNISIYVLTTKSENLSTALLQSMSCELPTITSDIENNRLLITPNETGWLYQNGNAEDLHKQMCACIASLQTDSNIPKQARKKIISHYSTALLFLKYDALLTKNNS